MRPERVSQPVELSIVVPCLNERRTVGVCVKKALAAMQRRAICGEVIVADNGSSDGSAEVATNAGASVVRAEVRGYGSALRTGLFAARGEFVLMADADESYDFSELGRFIDAARRGHDFVIGTRLRGRVMPGAMPLLNRYVGTPLLTSILNRRFGTRITDCNCGMRLLRRTTWLGLELQSNGMEYASEMLIQAARHNIAVYEVPITLHKDRRGRPSHLRRFQDGWRHLRLLLRNAPERHV